jgi:hypothetical protein
MDPGRELHDVAVPMIKQGAGSVSATRMRSLDGARTRSLILYEDEQTAKGAADRASQGPPPGAPTRFVSVEVFEVMARRDGCLAQLTRWSLASDRCRTSRTRLGSP